MRLSVASAFDRSPGDQNIERSIPASGQVRVDRKARLLRINRAGTWQAERWPELLRGAPKNKSSQSLKTWAAERVRSKRSNQGRSRSEAKRACPAAEPMAAGYLRVGRNRDRLQVSEA
jgi:hypothetical protein